MFKKPYISGIGGTGIRNIAHYFLELNKTLPKNSKIQIFGSEIKKSEFTEKLKSLGVKIFYSQTAKNIQKIQPDAFFYSQAIEDGEGKEELSEAKKLKISTFKNAEGYYELFKDKKIIAISGAHGKTTTTALTSIIFTASGLDPTCIIGSSIKEFADKNFPDGKSFRLGNGDFVIIEADEYKRNFLALKKIFGLIILNIEHDHPDCYKNINDVKNAFLELAKNVDRKGFILGFMGDKNIEYDFLIKNEFHLPLKIGVSYEKENLFKDNTSFNIRKEVNKNEIQKFFLNLEYGFPTKNLIFNQKNKKNLKNKFLPDIFEFSLETSLIGEKNIINSGIALSTFLTSILISKSQENDYSLEKFVSSKKNLKQNLRFEEIESALKNFSGIYRRQELVGKFNEIPVYDDYAHHPTQISVTILAFLQKFKHIAVIFESHQYKRTKELFDDFVQSFDALIDSTKISNGNFTTSQERGFGKLFLFPVYKVPGRDSDSDFVNHKIFGKKIRDRGVDVEVCESYDDLPKILGQISKENFDCILNLGAGPLSLKLRKLL